MQVIIGPRESLLKPLMVVSGVIESHPPMAILSNVLIRKEGSDVAFTGSNNEVQIRTHASIGAEGDPAAFTVSSRKILDLFKVLPNTEVTVSLSAPKRGISAEGGNQFSQKMEVKTATSRFSLQTIPAADYPAFPQEEFTNKVTVAADKLRYLLGLVHYAMAVQDIRYFLNGIRLEVKDRTIRAVATDGRRLALCDIAMDGEEDAAPVSATIPRRTVAELRRLLPDSDAPVTLEISEKQARFTFDGIELTTKLLEGKYPDYARVIPQNNDKLFLVDREALLGALHRTAVLTSDKFKGVRWMLNPGLLSVQSTNSEQEEGNDEIEVDYKGDPIDIGFNVDFLSDVLGSLKCEKVKVALSGPQGSALITMPDSDTFKYVLMPMRL